MSTNTDETTFQQGGIPPSLHIRNILRPCSHVPRRKYEMGIADKVSWPMRGFRLPPRCIWNLRSFRNLRCV